MAENTIEDPVVDSFSLLRDLPIGEANGQPGTNHQLEPSFNFKKYAKVLAAAAYSTPGPFTIGVFGEWGTGKTSLLRMIKEQLEEKETITIWFNAWRYENDEHPIIPLIATIERQLAEQGKGKKVLDALRAIAYAVGMKAKAEAPVVGGLELSLSGKDAIDRYEKLQTDSLLNQSLCQGVFQRLDAIKADDEDAVRVVILIDDLDRCFPDNAIKLLESIKLVLSQPNFIFVLAVSRKVIEGYLRHRYEKDFGILDMNGESYLDKIVQLPFYIPPHREKVDEFVENLKTNFENISEEFAMVLRVVGSACDGNPRALVRFTNLLLVDQAVDPTIDLELLAVSRAVEQWWVDLYKFLSRTDESFPPNEEWKSRVGKLLTLYLEKDHNLGNLLFSKIGRKWLQNGRERQELAHSISPSSEGEDVSWPSPELGSINYELARKSKVTSKDWQRAAEMTYQRLREQEMDADSATCRKFRDQVQKDN